MSTGTVQENHANAFYVFILNILVLFINYIRRSYSILAKLRIYEKILLSYKGPRQSSCILRRLEKMP